MLDPTMQLLESVVNRMNSKNTERCKICGIVLANVWKVPHVKRVHEQHIDDLVTPLLYTGDIRRVTIEFARSSGITAKVFERSN